MGRGKSPALRASPPQRGTPACQLPALARMHQDRVDLRPVEGREGRLPADPGPFHDRGLDAVPGQPGGHLRKTARKRAETARLRLGLAPATGKPNRRGDLHPVHVKPCRAGVDDAKPSVCIACLPGWLILRRGKTTAAAMPSRRRERRSEGLASGERMRLDLPRVHRPGAGNGTGCGTDRRRRFAFGNNVTGGKTPTRPRRHANPATTEPRRPAVSCYGAARSRRDHGGLCPAVTGHCRSAGSRLAAKLRRGSAIPGRSVGKGRSRVLIAASVWTGVSLLLERPAKHRNQLPAKPIVIVFGPTNSRAMVDVEVRLSDFEFFTFAHVDHGLAQAFRVASLPIGTSVLMGKFGNDEPRVPDPDAHLIVDEAGLCHVSHVNHRHVQMFLYRWFYRAPHKRVQSLLAELHCDKAVAAGEFSSLLLVISLPPFEAEVDSFKNNIRYGLRINIPWYSEDTYCWCPDDT